MCDVGNTHAWLLHLRVSLDAPDACGNVQSPGNKKSR